MTDTETPILWPPDAKSQLTGKDPDAKKDRGQEEKGMTEDEIVCLHHQLKAMVFPVVKYGCVSRTIKKAEHQRIDAFELWC